MPACTILIGANGLSRVRTVGLFEDTRLAERFLRRRRDITNGPWQIVEVEGSVEEHDLKTHEKLRTAANFALTLLSNPDKYKDEVFYTKAIKQLEAALGERSAMPKHKFTIYWRDGTVNTLEGIDITDALEKASYPREVYMNQSMFIVHFKDEGELL